MNTFMTLGLLLIFCGLFAFTGGVYEKYNLSDYVKKSDVKNSFSEVDWTKNVFRIGDITQKDTKGNQTFYASVEIDKAVDKINELLK